MYVVKEKQPSFFQSNCLGDFNDLKKLQTEESARMYNDDDNDS